MAIDLISNYIPIYLNLQTMEVNTKFWGKQGDTGRGFDVYLIDNGVVVSPTAEIVTFYAQKPDGTQVWIDGIPSTNKFRIDLTNQVFAIVGNVYCEISVISQGVRKTTENFVIQVESNLRESAVESVSQLGAVDEMISNLETFTPIIAGWEDAEEVRVSNESARESSEGGRVSAESARVSTEGARVTAESSRVSAESSRVTAESGRVTAESTRVSQENTRQSNESTRISNENARLVYEEYDPLQAYVPGNKVVYYGSSYVNILGSTGVAPTNQTNWLCIAEVVVGNIDGGTANDVYDIEPVEGAVAVAELLGVIQDDEDIRLANEVTRVSNESGRTSAESTRVTNESGRVSAESSRVTAESGRSTAEGLRVTAESNRVGAESDRTSAEGSRVAAESARDSAESGRTSAESGRVTAENTRVSQESDRQTNTTTAINNINTASNTTKLIWKNPVATYADIATTYPTPEEGWRVECTDTKIGYRYTVDTWVQIANSGYGYVPANDSEFDAHTAETSGRHIKESGSNANGSYIKFDDGTMICRKQTSVSDPTWVSVGSLFYTNISIGDWASAFYYTPTVSVFTASTNAPQIWAGGTNGVLSPTGLTNTTVFTCVNVPAETIAIHVTAFGRWKA